MREIVIDLQGRGIVCADYDSEALAVVWNTVALGLAEHRQAEPTLDLHPVYQLLQRSDHAAELSRLGSRSVESVSERRRAFGQLP